MTIDFYKYSNQGERPVNEDCVGVYGQNNEFAFALCDGLGGHGRGEVASASAVEAMLNTAATNFGKDNILEMCFESANEAVLNKQNEDEALSDMKTTATLLLLQNGLASWGHIGDSRIYYFKKKKFIKRTLDHSIPQMLVATGEIKEKDIRHHEDRNRLLRCIPWINKKYEIDETNAPVESGDCFLMMSDGFWDWVDEKNMKKAIKKTRTAEDLANYLIDVAFKNGKGKNMDNLSLIVIKI